MRSGRAPWTTSRASPRRPQAAATATAGRQVRFRGLGTRYVVSAEQTGGAFALVEHDLAPRSLGAPMHTHEREHEISHVTAGRLGVQIGDEVLEAGPGDTVVKPRGIPHAFWNPGAVMGRYALAMDMDSIGRLVAEHGLDARPPAQP